tara:strand:- start:781 stop:1749 length:969 start_codon:yes stop_codon:yes gene_type:complete
MLLEPILDPIFDDNSFGYRPRKSAHDAIEVTRTRCWQYDWVVEYDIQGLFDNIDHQLLLKALRHHCDCKWILLYVERWLTVSLQTQEGTLIVRDKGTPQGGVVSPLLATLFLHYAFDAWVRRELPTIPFCRYADDGLLHCSSYQEAESVLKRIGDRFRACGLIIHPSKTGIIYCKDRNRKKKFDRISFDFLGFTFRPRRCDGGKGVVHSNFLPAMSRPSRKAITQEIRSCPIQLKTDKSLEDLSLMFDRRLRGWKNYYGRFYPSAMRCVWQHFNGYLVRWVRRKYKRFAQHKTQACKYVVHIARANQNLFMHWKLGVFRGWQ